MNMNMFYNIYNDLNDPNLTEQKSGGLYIFIAQAALNTG